MNRDRTPRGGDSRKRRCLFLSEFDHDSRVLRLIEPAKMLVLRRFVLFAVRLHDAHRWALCPLLAPRLRCLAPVRALVGEWMSFQQVPGVAQATPWFPGTGNRPVMPLDPLAGTHSAAVQSASVREQNAMSDPRRTGDPERFSGACMCRPATRIIGSGKQTRTHGRSCTERPGHFSQSTSCPPAQESRSNLHPTSPPPSASPGTELTRLPPNQLPFAEDNTLHHAQRVV